MRGSAKRLAKGIEEQRQSAVKKVLWMNVLPPTEEQLQALDEIYPDAEVVKSRFNFEELTIYGTRDLAKKIAKELVYGVWIDVVVDTKDTLSMILLLQWGVQPLRSVVQGKTFKKFVRVKSFGLQLEEVETVFTQ